MTVDPEPRRPHAGWICLALVALVLVLYGQTRRHEFVSLDDPAHILENPAVSQGLTGEGVRWAFSNTESANWHPLTWLSHMVDVELFGLEPAGHHLHGALLHAINAMLLFLALRALTGAAWRSAVVAALFAVHPLRVESVAWAAERKDLLSGTFFMLALWSYARYARRPGGRRMLPVLIAGVLGLMAKPMLVTLPFVLLLLDDWPLGRFRAGKAGRLVREKLPLFAAAATSALLTYVYQRDVGAVLATGTLDLGPRLANALGAYAAYLWKSIWPLGLACFYPHPAAVGQSLWAPAIAGGGVLAAGTLAAIRLRGAFATGWLWYVGMLVPVIGLVQVGEQALADRYAYLPLIGIYIAAVWSVAALIEHHRRWRGAAVAVTAFLLAVLAAVTFVQIGHWSDSRALFEHALGATEDNYVAHYGLGLALAADGDRDGALEHYRRAVEIMPGFAEAHNNLGSVLLDQGRVPDAARHFAEAARRRPGYVEAHYNLGVALEHLGNAPQSVASYERALEIDPDYVPARFNLGLVLARAGEFERAATHLEQVVARRPGMTDARYNLALVYAQQGDLTAAATGFERLLRVAPDHAGALNNLGIIRARQGDLAEAARYFQRALEIDPDYREARDNLARARGEAPPAGDR